MSKPNTFLCHSVTQNLAGTEIHLKPAADGVALTSGVRIAMTAGDAALFGALGELQARQKFKLTIELVEDEPAAPAA